MSHIQYGTVVGAKDTGGVVDAHGAILLAEVETVAMEPVAIGPLGVRKDPPAIALQLIGRINQSPDTVGAVYLMSLADAGQLAGMLADAAARAAGQDGLVAFQRGVAIGMQR